MTSRHLPRSEKPAASHGALQITRIRLIGAVAAIGVTALSLAGCATHAATSPPAHPPGASTQPSPAASVAAAAAASPTPCPTDSGSSQNLSTAPPNLAAWLTAAQMPGAGVYDWAPQGGPIAMPFVQDMWNVLYGVGAGDSFLAWQLENYRGSTSGQFASQTVLLYATQAEAYCAYQASIADAAGNQASSRSIQSQYGIPPDAVTSETVSGAHDSAWTESWTGPAIPPVAHGPQTDVEYMVQVGTAVTFVSFVLPGLNQSVPDATAAQATLSEITQHLSVYASGS